MSLVDRFRDAKVNQLQLALDENEISGLQVTVHDALFMDCNSLKICPHQPNKVYGDGGSSAYLALLLQHVAQVYFAELHNHVDHIFSLELTSESMRQIILDFFYDSIEQRNFICIFRHILFKVFFNLMLFRAYNSPSGDSTLKTLLLPPLPMRESRMYGFPFDVEYVFRCQKITKFYKKI